MSVNTVYGWDWETDSNISWMLDSCHFQLLIWTQLALLFLVRLCLLSLVNCQRWQSFCWTMHLCKDPECVHGGSSVGCGLVTFCHGPERKAQAINDVSFNSDSVSNKNLKKIKNKRSAQYIATTSTCYRFDVWHSTHRPIDLQLQSAGRPGHWGQSCMPRGSATSGSPRQAVQQKMLTTHSATWWMSRLYM